MQGRKVRGEWRAVNDTALTLCVDSEAMSYTVWWCREPQLGAKCRWAVWRRLRARCVHAIKPAHHCLERRVERDNSALKKLLSPGETASAFPDWPE